jgi:nitrogen-specific signal transduction histidine kinase
LLKVTQHQASSLARHRRELEEKTEALARASDFKSRFLANMSHELRSPLNSISLLAQMMTEEAHSPEQVAENARIIGNCSQELLTLINDILDLAKVEAGKLDYQHEDVDPRDLAFTIESSQGVLARRKGLHFEVICRPESPPTVVTDRQRILQILRNLVANAIKFTDQGHVLVSLDWVEPNVADGPGQLVIAVADTGVGIEPEDQELVFEEFEQTDATRMAGLGGTGLGLSISSKLARDLGGKLELLSSPGLGSTFTLRLPCRVADRQTPRSAEQAASWIADLVEEGIAQGERVAPDAQTGQEDGAWLAGHEVLVLGSDMRRIYSLTAELERKRSSGAGQRGCGPGADNPGAESGTGAGADRGRIAPGAGCRPGQAADPQRAAQDSRGAAGRPG